MKYMILMTSMVALGAASSTFAADEVDFKRVNPVLDVITKSLLEGDDQIVFAYPTFDESYSSIQSERLRYNLTGKIINTRWSKTPAEETTVDATASVYTDRDPAHLGVFVTFGGTAMTDTLALARYSGTVALRESHDLDPKFEKRIIGHLNRVAAVGSLEDLHALTYSGIRLSEEIAQDEVAKKQTYLDCLRAKTCGRTPIENDKYSSWEKQIEWAQDDLDEATAMLNGIATIKLETSSLDGKMASITVTVPDGKTFMSVKNQKYAQPGQLKFELTEKRIAANGEGFAPLELKDLEKLKTDLNATLVGAQNGEKPSHDEIQKSFREALIDFKSVINGQKKY